MRSEDLTDAHVEYDGDDCQYHRHNTRVLPDIGNSNCHERHEKTKGGISHDIKPIAIEHPLVRPTEHPEDRRNKPFVDKGIRPMLFVRHEKPLRKLPIDRNVRIALWIRAIKQPVGLV